MFSPLSYTLRLAQDTDRSVVSLLTGPENGILVSLSARYDRFLEGGELCGGDGANKYGHGMGITTLRAEDSLD